MLTAAEGLQQTTPLEPNQLGFVDAVNNNLNNSYKGSPQVTLESSQFQQSLTFAILPFRFHGLTGVQSAKIERRLFMKNATRRTAHVFVVQIVLCLEATKSGSL